MCVCVCVMGENQGKGVAHGSRTADRLQGYRAPDAARCWDTLPLLGTGPADLRLARYKVTYFRGESAM